MSRYYRPIPVTDPAHMPRAPRLAGGWTAVREVEILSRDTPPRIVPIETLPEATRHRLLAPRADFAGLSMDRPRLMGILNLTPDSFSDGGRLSDVADATEHARAMVAAGADIIDIGGESTRPGAVEVSVGEEIARVLPVIEALKTAADHPPISLDTRKSRVASATLAAGVDVLNDVSGLRFDPALAGVAAEAGAGLILMHSIGTPETMQAEAAGAYEDVVLDIYDGLEAAVAVAEAAGVARSRIVVDPGIGFGKTPDQNRAILARLSIYHGLGCPILLGVSRKGFVGQVTGVTNPSDRDPGSAAIGLWAISQGVQILRIHDISLHKQAISAWEAVAAR